MYCSGPWDIHNKWNAHSPTLGSPSFIHSVKCVEVCVRAKRTHKSVCVCVQLWGCIHTCGLVSWCNPKQEEKEERLCEFFFPPQLRPKGANRWDIVLSYNNGYLLLTWKLLSRNVPVTSGHNCFYAHINHHVPWLSEQNQSSHNVDVKLSDPRKEAEPQVELFGVQLSSRLYYRRSFVSTCVCPDMMLLPNTTLWRTKDHWLP